MPISALVLSGSCSEPRTRSGSRFGRAGSFGAPRNGRISASPRGAESDGWSVSGVGFEDMCDFATYVVPGRGCLISVDAALAI